MELATAEVVPTALRADLDDVAIELVVLARELVELAGLGQRSTVRGSQTVAVHVRDVEEIFAPTHRTGLPNPITDIARGAQELRMRVAHVVTADAAGSQVP